MISWRLLYKLVPLLPISPFDPGLLPTRRVEGRGPPSKRPAKQRNKWPARQRARSRRRR
jgi:hypothetical protein